MKKTVCVIVAALMTSLVPSTLQAQLTDYQDVTFFQNPLKDANQFTAGYGEVHSSHTLNSNKKTSDFGILAAMPFANLQVAVNWLYYMACYPCGTKYKGLLDPEIHGKYSFLKTDRMTAAAGAYATLPIGAGEVGAGRFNYGIWGAARFYTCAQFLLRLYMGIGFYEMTTSTSHGTSSTSNTEYKSRVQFGAGAMKQVKSGLYAIADASATLNSTTEIKATAGVEYQKGPYAFRGSAGINRNAYTDTDDPSWTTSGLFMLGVRVTF